MKTINKTMLTANTDFNISLFDSLAFYDAETGKIAVISARSFVNKNYDDYAIVSKTAELLGFGQIKLVNVEDFIRKNPDSGIEAYMEADHYETAYHFDFYLAAYIILYRFYKSLEALSENGLFGLIDSFIDNCISSSNDHPGTITYFNYEIHKVLKLRKTVYEMFRKYFTNYSNYYYIFMNQHAYNYTDKQFREFRKTLRKSDEAGRTTINSGGSAFEETESSKIA